MSTTKKKPAKNLGGRPPRAPGEKLQRVSLTLRPSLLFGLEVVARDRRTSLSQAAEYLIEQQLRTYEVGGTRANELLDAATRIYAKALAPQTETDTAAVVNLLLASEAGRAFFMPADLQQPAERYLRALFKSVLSRLRQKAEESESANNALALVMKSLVTPSMLEGLFDIAKESEKAGRDVELEASEFVEALIYPEAP